MCGGTPDGSTRVVEQTGLSPRVRGNQPPGPIIIGGSGSIPACAGEPRSRARVGDGAGVYPRVCGGTGKGETNTLPGTGLSPRVRGNRIQNIQVFVHTRSIPACAGEPLSRDLCRPTRWVYPRVCGGTVFFGLHAPYTIGLSPRVRGNPPPPTLHRSIPACAGEPAAAYHAPVYPRVCGGTGMGWGMGLGMNGLSPRVRGNRTTLTLTTLATRSIPACAGEPPVVLAARPCQQVYPRVCGGTPANGQQKADASGLSPRVRGNHTDMDTDNG